jgi:hypothetical protein
MIASGGGGRGRAEGSRPASSPYRSWLRDRSLEVPDRLDEPLLLDEPELRELELVELGVPIGTLDRRSAAATLQSRPLRSAARPLLGPLPCFVLSVLFSWLGKSAL